MVIVNTTFEVLTFCYLTDFLLPCTEDMYVDKEITQLQTKENKTRNYKERETFKIRYITNNILVTVCLKNGTI